MSYMHIDNLYKDQRVLLFKEVYATEKIHGTSAHVAFDGSEGPNGLTHVFPGATKLATFMQALPPPEQLHEAFKALGHANVTVYGEAYGGSCQRMKATYGDKLKFIAFEVKIGDTFLAVPQAAEVATKLGFEFVHYKLVPATVDTLNAERDAPSVQAERNGMGSSHKREGIVIRPPIELTDNAGKRLIAKHKGEEFQETATKRDVLPEQAKVLSDAEAIALEWVTDVRLQHVLDALAANGKQSDDVSCTGDVIKAMTEDVLREANTEIVASKEARKAIGARAAKLFKAQLQGALK